MRPRIAILAALPREIAPLVRDWPLHSRSRSEGWAISENEQAIAVSAGMGRGRVARAMELAGDRGPLSAIFSVGYAGALRPGIQRCSVFWPSAIVDARTGEQFLCAGGNGTLVTADHVVEAQEKAQMATRWSADLVDMETAAIARLAKVRGLPFRAARAVSDELGDTLPDFNGFIDRNGGIRQAAMVVHLALHPDGIPAAVRFGRHSWQASLNLAASLRDALENAE